MMLISQARKASILWLFAATIICSGLRAQQKLLTIQDLIDSALIHYPIIQQKQMMVKAAAAEIENTKAEYLPKLIAAEQLSAGSANGIRSSVLPLNVAPSVSAVIRDDNKYDAAVSNFASLYGEYLVSDFGYRQARLETAEANVLVQKADMEREGYLLKLNICRLYFNILQRRNQLKADLRNKERYESIYRVIYAITESGIQAGVDSALAKAEVSKAIINYNQTRLLLQQQYADLAMQTGIAQHKLSLDSFSQVFKDVPLETLDLQGDSSNNPLLDIYEQNQLRARQNMQLISKSYMPKLIAGASLLARGSSINGQDDYKNPVHGLGYQRFNYVAGIGINYDLFNGARKRKKLVVADYQLKALQQETDFQKISLQNISDKASMAAQNARATLNELPLQALAAEKVYQQKLAQYKAGIADLVDLTNASFVMYRSQTDYIQALGDWYRSTLEKAAANGQLDSFIQTIK